MSILSDFEDLSPDYLISVVEEVLEIPMSGFTYPLPSYINRVYELKSEDGESYIAKFYRPGRWSLKALFDEHAFTLDLANADISVVPPLYLSGKNTIADADGIYFSVFPKKAGRGLELYSDEQWIRIGALLGRVHLEGMKKHAANRITLTPSSSTKKDVDFLLDGDFIPFELKGDFTQVCNDILDSIIPLFDGVKMQRIHGDCHAGNILDRADEGLLLIDFDDMANGPSIQDFWMLLPDHMPAAQKELNLMIEGYEQFYSFDYSSIKLIEPLRAMRIIYFTAWCAKQKNDYNFEKHFPGWGSKAFWIKEIEDLRAQLDLIRGLV